jgi:FtsP/CotA-like multicopper oxidase with cupredoxin domain
MTRISSRILLAVAVLAMLALPTQAAVRNLYLAASDGYAYLPVDNTVPPFQTTERRYYIRGYCDDVDGTQAVPGCSTFPAPIIDVNQGDDVFIQLRNIGNANPFAPPDPHTIHLHGQHVTTQNDGFPESGWELPVPEECPAGNPTCNVGTYYFYAEKPGTYMWHCHVEASEHVQMGMYGAMIIRPKQNATRTVFGGQYNDRFDKEYIVLLSDVELQAHDFIEWADAPAEVPRPPGVPADYNFGKYKADNWLVNGRAFPDTIRPTYEPAAGCAPECNPEFSGPPSGYLTGANNYATYAPLVDVFTDSRFLLRVINMGYETVPWHVHGWHFTAVGKDASPVARDAQMEAYTLHIGSGETYDLIIQADSRKGVGLYSTNSTNQGVLNEFAEILGSYPADNDLDDQWFPMHNHNDYTVTNAGFYPGGQLLLIHSRPVITGGIAGEPTPVAPAGTTINSGDSVQDFGRK